MIAMSEHLVPVPMRGRFLTPGTLVVLAVALAGVSAYLARMVLGLGAVTNLSNPYPWGIWISIDVASGVALAAGGFTSSALVYVFGHEKYHALIRPALLTALLGYTFVVIGLLADLGRYYNVWHPMLPSMWQGNSVLFEVGICVIIYLTVLYIEFVPIAAERFMGKVALPGALGALNGLVEALLRLADKTLHRFIGVFIVAGVVLSCLHQSSLGTLMLIAPTKMHVLWYTPVMPAFFLMSAIAVGLPMIIFEGLIAARSFKLEPELQVFTSLGRIIPFLLGVYGIAKVTDITIREAWPAAFDGSPAATAFLVELVGGVFLPVALFLVPKVRKSPRGLFVAASLVVLGVALNRVNVFLVAYTPPFTTTTYFPSVFEIMVTAGLIATLVLVYRAAVMIFPVISASGRAGIAGGLVVVMGLCSGPDAHAAAKKQAQGSGNAAVEQPNCVDCHTCDKPSEGHQCLKPCPRLFAAHNKSAHGLAEAPDVLLIDSLADQYGGVQFNHKLHAGMSEMGQGCAACHHFCPPGKIPACVTCHASDVKSTDLRQPGLKGAYHRQCLQCHREWSHETYCNVCHLQKVLGAKTTPHDKEAAKPSTADATDIMGKSHPALSPPDKRVYVTPYAKGPVVTFYHQQHIDLFGLKCTNCHQQENCSYCHDWKRTDATKKTMEQVHAVCSNCHKTDGCAKCHDTKERPGFSHASTGWPLNGFHTVLACRACHPTGKPLRKLDPECTSCHTVWKQGRFRHAVTGIALDETHLGLECSDCHAKLKFAKAPTCVGCHDDGRDYHKTPPGSVVKGAGRGP